MFSSLLIASLLALGINAQSPVWGQCGGNGWTGATTCVAGSTCVKSNDWYSQCLPGSNGGGTTTTTTRTTGTGPTTTTQVPVGSATLYLAGDSTTALDQGTAYQGWGAQIGKYLSIPVVNNAVAGKSSRSFTDLGYFSQMYSRVKAGDVVIIEFGHNEGGGPQGNPQQGVCAGTSLTTTCNDNGKVVYTYFKYMTDAINSFKAKGAKVIVSSQTPNNPFKDTSGTPIYVDYAQQVASQTSVAYVDHFNYLKTRYQTLGASATNALFPQDNIHTNSNGADVAAQALIRGALCASGNPLAPYVKNTSVNPPNCL
ncbi:carbohydrate esterase family 12 protein [Tulasnella calospora MUT 4182]|uniref:Carbohydrate esterase family 12 protein n=1 Tax=Tulasnella calospora MUT 4182 TaxID=1051891 RepID=A0A0C3L486_9AGAM|nr:carbohydrate esterase family 12 protein [Tulasnella calospora MUT 4182]